MALRRVGEWVGFEGDELSEYLATVRPIHNQALEDRKAGQAERDLRDEYFEFLNENVLSAEPVITHLRRYQTDEEVVGLFETASVPIRDTFRSQSVIDYELDEIVDFVMLLKLLERYHKMADSGIEPLENLHSLVYLTNYQLSESDSYSVTEDHGFGMLEKTGYRYTFERRDDYVWSDSLQRDLDRLVAWQLFDRELIDEPKPEWDRTYSISLGQAATLFLTRFEKRLDSFDSLLLKEWEMRQNDVIDDFATSSKVGISSHLESLDRFSNSSDGQIVLNGRAKKFTSDQDQRGIKINV
ncbi:hypothetical protein PM031_15500 [Halorubrum ezzemoulense]|uniref:hypothetical protein n=1 Tax=Halorubrum ezzemoulense TaxID=337243 RepID=UPI00232BF589|nr:hypothetical protein [Halorubrum ezzemoulense]MDB2262254.1 hypothetical protein [Halorubrum ezzemoulense]